MPHSEANNNLEQTIACKILSLVADEEAKIILSDLPVFGANLTFREDIAKLEDSIVYPCQPIGWIDYSSLTKLACLNQQRYFDAQHFLKVEQHQLFFSKTVKVHTVNNDLKLSKTILTFSIVPELQNPVVVNIRK
jgi:hypothetical protein